MKKIIYSFAVAAVAFGMTACGGNKAEGEDTTAADSVITETAEIIEDSVVNDSTIVDRRRFAFLSHRTHLADYHRGELCATDCGLLDFTQPDGTVCRADIA